MHVSCLVRPAHKVQVMLLQEVSNTVWPKRVAHATVVLAPALDVLVRVCPQQVAQQPAAAAAVTAAAQAAAATALSLHKQNKAVAAAVALETDKQPAKLWGSINQPIKRHTHPLSGTSVGRATRLICSRDRSSGDRPPCMHRICVVHTTHHTRGRPGAHWSDDAPHPPLRMDGQPRRSVRCPSPTAVAFDWCIGLLLQLMLQPQPQLLQH